VVLSALAAALTLFVAPRTNRIYYDEQIYQGIAHNMADLRRAQMCLDGSVEYGRLDCLAGEYNKQPYAYPHLLSLMYRVGGAHPDFAFVLNAFAIAATVASVYFIVLLLFDDRLAALFAGLVMALIPQQLLWSATAAVEPLATLASAVAVAATAFFVNSRTTAALAAAAVASAYAVQFRPESFLVVPIVGLLLVQHAREELRKPRLWLAAGLALALVAVHLAHLTAVRNEGWGTTEARFSLAYVLPNLEVNGRFYMADERFPVLYTVLAAIGLLAAGATAARLAMLLYFLAFFAVTLLFYAGSYNYGADVRYSLMTYPPLAVLAGLGAACLVRQFGRAHESVILRRTMVAVVAFQFLWYTPVVRATTDEAWAARADVEFARRVAETLPANSYVLTHNPGMFHLWGTDAGQMFTAIDNPARLQHLQGRYAGGVFLHWNFWCNVMDPVQQDICRKAASSARTEPFVEHRVRDQRFAFMRIYPPTPVPHESPQRDSSR
jgi:hypothetical protein